VSDRAARRSVGHRSGEMMGVQFGDAQQRTGPAPAIAQKKRRLEERLWSQLDDPTASSDPVTGPLSRGFGSAPRGIRTPTARSVAWCSTSIWSAPDGSGLLRLEAPSIWTDPDGSRRIVWMIKRMIKGHPTENRRARRATPVVGPPNWLPASGVVVVIPPAFRSAAEQTALLDGDPCALVQRLEA
jgi:hypothetical protein